MKPKRQSSFKIFKISLNYVIDYIYKKMTRLLSFVTCTSVDEPEVRNDLVNN